MVKDNVHLTLSHLSIRHQNCTHPTVTSDWEDLRDKQSRPDTRGYALSIPRFIILTFYHSIFSHNLHTIRSAPFLVTDTAL